MSNGVWAGKFNHSFVLNDCNPCSLRIYEVSPPARFTIKNVRQSWLCEEYADYVHREIRSRSRKICISCLENHKADNLICGVIYNITKNAHEWPLLCHFSILWHLHMYILEPAMRFRVYRVMYNRTVLTNALDT